MEKRNNTDPAGPLPPPLGHPLSGTVPGQQPRKNKGSLCSHQAEVASLWVPHRETVSPTGRQSLSGSSPQGDGRLLSCSFLGVRVKGLLSRDKQARMPTAEATCFGGNIRMFAEPRDEGEMQHSDSTKCVRLPGGRCSSHPRPGLEQGPNLTENLRAPCRLRAVRVRGAPSPSPAQARLGAGTPHRGRNGYSDLSTSFLVLFLLQLCELPSAIPTQVFGGRVQRRRKMKALRGRVQRGEAEPG